jgi:hypothetical protein
MDSEAAAAAPTDEASGDNSTRCEACRSCGAILELDGCGHRFHARCIYAWPATHCEVCDEPVAAVFVFREGKRRSNSGARKGKWSIDEHKYANMMMKQFQLGALPLLDGLHLRVFIANLLQCDPLRVTKKYAGQAIGKQNFSFQRQKSYCYNLHVKLQKQLSNLRNHYYWHLQYRCKFGPSLNIQELKAAEADYWIHEFCRFAKKIGQRVELIASATSSTAIDAASQGNSSAKDVVIPRPAIAERTKAESTTAAATHEPVLLPPVSSLLTHMAGVNGDDRDSSKQEWRAKGEEDSQELKDALSGMLGFSASMYRSPSPLSADEWNDPSAFVDLAALTDSQGEVPAASTTDTPATAYPQESLKKSSLVNDWMKEAELEWSKGAISWSLTLSAEPLADFA